MIAGRIVGDLATIAVGVSEITTGGTMAGGGAVVGCGATLCLAAAPAIAAGAAVVSVGAMTTASGSLALGENIARLSSPKQNVDSVSINSSSSHGNSLNSNRQTYLYELSDLDGNHLKYGITSQTNPENRYPRIFLKDKIMTILADGTRREMYQLENEFILNNPRGLLQLNNH